MQINLDLKNQRQPIVNLLKGHELKNLKFSEIIIGKILKL